MGDALVALVTGAAGGIGKAAAQRLAADGHRVAVNDIAHEERPRDLAREVGGIVAPGDIADPEATAAIVAETTKALGPVQVLVANAADMAMSPFLDADPARWWRQVEVNLSGHFRLTQAVIPGMRALGEGRIIVIASGLGRDRSPERHTAALPMLRSVARQHGPVALVHFDAHLDTWDTYFGTPVTHGTMSRRAFEENLPVEDHSIHVGIRGPIYGQANLADDRRFGFRTIRASDIDDLGTSGTIEAITDRTADLPVHLSVDIDVPDPSFAPGTGIAAGLQCAGV